MSSNNTGASSCCQDEAFGGKDVHMIGGDLNKDFVEMELRPYRYMAGGHSYVLEVTKSAICKNFRQRESEFYRNIPDELRPFTPQYLGNTLSTYLYQLRLYFGYTLNIIELKRYNIYKLLLFHNVNETFVWINTELLNLFIL